MRIDAIRLGIVTCYLLRDRGTMLVDAGVPWRRETFLRRLLELSVELRAISLVVVTHGHFDHVGLANEIRAATGAAVAIHRDDAALVEDGRISVPRGTTRWGRLSVRILLPLVRPVARFARFRPDIVLDDRGLDLSEHGVAGRVVHTPGHTAGSVSVVLDSGEAFVGDLAMNGLPLTVRPSLPIYADDIEAVNRSWGELRRLGVRTVYPAHGRPFPIEALSRHVV